MSFELWPLRDKLPLIKTPQLYVIQGFISFESYFSLLNVSMIVGYLNDFTSNSRGVMIMILNLPTCHSRKDPFVRTRATQLMFSMCLGQKLVLLSFIKFINNVISNIQLSVQWFSCAITVQ